MSCIPMTDEYFRSASFSLRDVSSRINSSRLLGELLKVFPPAEQHVRPFLGRDKNLKSSIFATSNVTLFLSRRRASGIALGREKQFETRRGSVWELSRGKIFCFTGRNRLIHVPPISHGSIRLFDCRRGGKTVICVGGVRRLPRMT